MITVVPNQRRFQRSAVPVYWIVDLDARLVEVWTPSDHSPAVVDDALTWHLDPNHAPLVIDLAACFREIYGDPCPL